MKQNIVGLSIDHRPKNIAINSPYRNVETLVHDALIQANLGQTDNAAPLADIIKPGMSVLIKPNWVYHHNKSGFSAGCVITHPDFIISVLKEVVACRPDRIIIGDAPIQGCEWDKLITSEFRNLIFS
jgi:hypothetical protein